MSTSNSLVGDMSFSFSFPPTETPAVPSSFVLDPSLLKMPSYTPGHARSSSKNSVFSNVSQASTVATEVSVGPGPTRQSVTPKSSRPATPVRSSSPPIRQHGPILLPKIRSQDQDIQSSVASSSPLSSMPKPAKRQRTMGPASKPATPPPATTGFRPVHSRSFTHPEPIVNFNLSVTPPPEDQLAPSSLLCSPIQVSQDINASGHSRKASTCSLGGSVVEKYGFPTYRQMPNYTTTASATSSVTATATAPLSNIMHPHAEAFMLSSMAFSKPPSPLSLAGSAEPVAQAESATTILSYLGAPNPAPSLVRTLSFPFRDPNTKNFWWDVRQVRPWTTFTSLTILSLPGALASLTCPVPQSLLPMPSMGGRHPETEAQLHSIYASHYLPRLNAALAVSSPRPIQFSLPRKPLAGLDSLIIANVSGDSASASAIFGGNPSARIVGIVRSFDRFNTGMRVEGNVKKVEYLRGLAALHHAMRQHGCRYGFILTEIELVIARNGSDNTPHFGYLEITSVQLAATGSADHEEDEHELTACLAIWGLAQMASMDAQTAAQNGVAPWKAEIGAPAEGTRRRALSRDIWMPQPQLAEKREAKRARGWIWPEDPVCRKELGRRGVRYSAF